MGEATKIQWTGDTFNPWRGCTKVHEGCKFCYAEREAKRFPNIRGKWGPNGTRVVAAEDMWRKPLKWNREAQKAGERRKVFCSSLADVFEDWGGPMLDAKGSVLFSGNVLSRPWRDTGNPKTDKFLTMGDVRLRLFDLIDATPWLDWQLLTKRPENVRRMWPDNPIPMGPSEYRLALAGKANPNSRHNVWIGTSVSDQETAEKYVPQLLKLRDLTPCLFLSCEPLVGPVELSELLPKWFYECQTCGASGESPERPGDPCGCEPPEGRDGPECDGHLEVTRGSGPDWVIVGGESGPGARPCDVAWIRSLVQQCGEADVPVFVKQLGSQPVYRHGELHTEIDGTDEGFRQRRPSHPKGGDPAEWPEHLRVREFPRLSGTV